MTLHRGNVLVVDDDDDIRETLISVLEDEGYAVRGAINGRDALDKLLGERPSVVLLDLMMPEMSGAEVVEHMRRDDALAAIPIVLFSAWTKDAETMGGVQARLSKPVQLAQLLEVVERFCG